MEFFSLPDWWLAFLLLFLGLEAAGLWSGRQSLLRHTLGVSAALVVAAGLQLILFPIAALWLALTVLTLLAAEWLRARVASRLITPVVLVAVGALGEIVIRSVLVRFNEDVLWFYDYAYIGSPGAGIGLMLGIREVLAPPWGVRRRPTEASRAA